MTANKEIVTTAFMFLVWQFLKKRKQSLLKSWRICTTTFYSQFYWSPSMEGRSQLCPLCWIYWKRHIFYPRELSPTRQKPDLMIRFHSLKPSPDLNLTLSVLLFSNTRNLFSKTTRAARFQLSRNSRSTTTTSYKKRRRTSTSQQPGPSTEPSATKPLRMRQRFGSSRTILTTS